MVEVAGLNEHALHHERMLLCSCSVAEALVPDREQLEQWGGYLHPEQLFSEYRMLKAPLVLRTMQQQESVLVTRAGPHLT